MLFIHFIWMLAVCWFTLDDVKIQRSNNSVPSYITCPDVIMSSVYMVATKMCEFLKRSSTVILLTIGD